MVNAYKKLVIYYFSGTGNARQTARWIVGEAKSRGLETHHVNIDRLKKIEIPDGDDQTLTGFCGPTHGFNFPPVMLKFLWKFPRKTGRDVFIINTRAGMKLWKYFLPGLGGLAQYFAAVVLWSKGYKIRGMQPMDLPSNWISLHPGLRPKVVDSIFARCEKISLRFANKMLDGKKVYRALLSLPFDLAVAPIAAGYYFIGRFAIAKTFVATSVCTNCGICEKNCPVGAIKNIGHRPYWTFSCESCMRCMNACPERAIETSHSLSIGLWWAFLVLLSPWIVSQISGGSPDGWLQSLPGGKTLLDIILWFAGLAVIWLGYRFTHYLMRYKYFNMIVAYTSMTRYRFWRRYKPRRSLSGPKA